MLIIKRDGCQTYDLYYTCFHVALHHRTDTERQDAGPAHLPNPETSFPRTMNPTRLLRFSFHTKG